MLLRIDFRSGKPIYLQVADQIKSAAAAGTLRPGEALPSISGLSGELRINRNAVAKAYAELEGAGLIELRGSGEFFLRERSEPRKEVRSAAPGPQLVDDVARKPMVLPAALQYSLLAVLLAALYLVMAFLGVRAWLASALLAIAFLPLFRLTGKAAYRIVFAKRFEFPRILRALKIEAPTRPNLESFMERVIEKTEPILGARLALIEDRAQVASLLHSFPALSSARTPVVAGADLLTPIFHADEGVHGILRLPPKSNGREYGAPDLKFLSALAELLATAADQFRMRDERQESEYAREIQQGLLPRDIPQVAGFSIAGAWQPARTVGGDYYDAFLLGETALALTVADVSGKGVPAALLMSNLQATVKAYAAVEPCPKDLTSRVNRAICNSITPGKFITFFYAVLDSTQRRLTYANAGHNPPLLVRQDGNCVRLEPNGALLGIFPQGSYDQAAIDLLPGDRLVMFTDGITEAANSSQEEFGEERLIAGLRESTALTADGLRHEIMQRVTQFCRGDFADDATLLALVVDHTN